MIAVDTNLLVYAHRRDSTWHDRAQAELRGLAEGRAAWAIPWPCLAEFLAVSTHPKIYQPASTQAQALAQMEAWLESPALSLLGEKTGYLELLTRTLRASRVIGPRIHDARIAALCLLHGVSELWTVDRDFSRFPDLKTRNPLLAR